MIQEYHPEIEVIGFGANVQDSIKMIRQRKVDIIFLSLELSDSPGFDLIRDISDTTSIIAISAHAQYAYDTFEHNVTDYLAKPVSAKALNRAIQKVKNKRMYPHVDNMETGRNAKPDSAKNTQLPGYTGEKMIMVSSYNSNLEIIEIRNIMFLKAEGKYTYIYLHNDKPVISSKNLKEFEEILSGQFIRVHNSYIVNLSFSRSFSKNELAIIMKSGEKIPVSLRKKDAFLQLFQRL
jgi:two-component system LytT family response regulator